MVGAGTLSTPALNASGATLDFSSQTLDRMTGSSPFLSTALTVSSTTVLKLPSTASLNDTYKLATSISSNLEVEGATVYFGDNLQTGITATYSTDGTVSFSQNIYTIKSGATAKVSEISTSSYVSIQVLDGGTLTVDQAPTIPVIGAGTAQVVDAATLSISGTNWSDFTGSFIVNNASAVVTFTDALGAFTITKTAGTVNYSGTNLAGTTLDGVILTGNNYITVSGTTTIKNLAGNDLTSGGSFNYAFVGTGTLNFEGTCNLMKTSTGADNNKANKIGMGSGNNIYVKSGANLTAFYIYNTAASGNESKNANVTVEKGATLTVQDIYAPTLSSDGTVTINGTAYFSTKLYGRQGTVTLNGINSTAATVEFGDINDTSVSSTLNIKEGSTLTVTGSDQGTGGNYDSYKQSGVVLGEWGSTTTVNCNGTLKSESATLQPGDTGYTLNIGANGSVSALGIGANTTCKSGYTQAITINKAETGTIAVGENGYLTDRTITYKTTISRETAANKYGTICVPAAATVSNATILACQGKNSNNQIVFDYASGDTDEESTTLEAGVPYLYRATGEGSPVFTINGNYTALGEAQGGALMGSYEETELNADNCILKDGKFYTVALGTGLSTTNIFVGAYRAYVTDWDDLTVINTPARAFTFSLDGGSTTGINGIVDATATAKDGKFVENGKVVIVNNGKKFNVAGQAVK